MYANYTRNESYSANARRRKASGAFQRSNTRSEQSLANRWKSRKISTATLTPHVPRPIGHCWSKKNLRKITMYADYAKTVRRDDPHSANVPRRVTRRVRRCADTDAHERSAFEISCFQRRFCKHTSKRSTTPRFSLITTIAFLVDAFYLWIIARNYICSKTNDFIQVVCIIICLKIKKPLTCTLHSIHKKTISNDEHYLLQWRYSFYYHSMIHVIVHSQTRITYRSIQFIYNLYVIHSNGWCSIFV